MLEIVDSDSDSEDSGPRVTYDTEELGLTGESIVSPYLYSSDWLCQTSVNPRRFRLLISPVRRPVSELNII